MLIPFLSIPYKPKPGLSEVTSLVITMIYEGGEREDPRLAWLTAGVFFRD